MKRPPGAKERVRKEKVNFGNQIHTVQWLAKSASAQTHSFKKSAPLLDPGPYQWPYQTQSSAYRGLRTRYLLLPAAVL